MPRFAGSSVAGWTKAGRTDTAVGMVMARRIRRLVGHRFVVWVEVEQIRDGASKTRVICHVEELGIAAPPERLGKNEEVA